METIERKFASSEARVYLFSAIVYLLVSSQTTGEAGGQIFMVSLIAYMAWLGVRCWNVPCARMDAENLVVYDQGRPKHYIPLAQVKEVQKGFNRTLLLMRDGLTIPISHVNFVKKADVTEFRAALAERLSTAATT